MKQAIKASIKQRLEFKDILERGIENNGQTFFVFPDKNITLSILVREQLVLTERKMRFRQRTGYVLPCILLLVTLCYISGLVHAVLGQEKNGGKMVKQHALDSAHDDVYHFSNRARTSGEKSISENEDDVNKIRNLDRVRSAEFPDSIGVNEYRIKYQRKYGGENGHWAVDSNGREILKTVSRCPSGDFGNIGDKGCKVVSIVGPMTYSGDVWLKKDGILSFYITEPIDPERALLNVKGGVNLEGKIRVEFSFDYNIESLGQKSTIRLISAGSSIQSSTNDVDIEYTWDVCQNIKINKVNTGDINSRVLDYELDVDTSLCKYSWVFIVIFSVLLLLSIGLLCIAHYRNPESTGITLLKKRSRTPVDPVQMSQYEEDL